MRLKATVTSLFILFLFAASPAWAQVRMFTITVPTPIANPLDGFTIDYTLGGSKTGVGSASAQLKFYISASADGSTGVQLLYSSQIQLSGSGTGPYYPPLGTQSLYLSRFSMQPGAVTLLENITAACQPQTWYILGQVDSTAVKSGPSLLGSSKLPDFYFTGGTLSPSVIQPGGATNVSFSLYTRCPASTSSTVGIFLADANYQLLAFIGGVPISAGAGTFTLPPTSITFSPSIAPGTYRIVLISDVDGVIAESNENNNSGAFTLNITAGALAATGNDTDKMELDVALPADAASGLSGLESGAFGASMREF